MNESNCPCGARMIWAKTINGKDQPLDAEPSPQGNILLDDSEPPVARVLRAEQLEAIRTAYAAGEVGAPKLYTPHHGTCPKAAEFRKHNTSSATAAKVFGEVPKEAQEMK